MLHIVMYMYVYIVCISHVCTYLQPVIQHMPQTTFTATGTPSSTGNDSFDHQTLDQGTDIVHMYTRIV